MKTTVLTLVLMFLSFLANALEDTPANRGTQADRYLSIQPPKALIADMAEQMSHSLPPAQREAYKKFFNKHLDIEAVTTAIRASLIKFFTADELRALADFYGSTEGKSAMTKFGAYMADIAPTLQAETERARMKAIAEMRAAAEAEDASAHPSVPAPPTGQ